MEWDNHLFVSAAAVTCHRFAWTDVHVVLLGAIVFRTDIDQNPKGIQWIKYGSNSLHSSD